MSKVSAARKLATAAVYGGGGLSLLGGSLYGVLSTEARVARMRIGNANDTPPDPSGLYGFDLPGKPIRLAVLGDSAAAGYGARTPSETFGAYLASALADAVQAPVFLSSVAVVGAQTSDLPNQIPRALAARPDVFAMIIGANDVTHKVRPSTSVRSLHQAVAAMRDAGAEVVVGTCPDLGTIRPIAPPLRQVARRWSRRLAAAQAITVVEAGGSAVSLGTILGPEFAAAPAEMFGPDRFHPSPAGYRSCAAAMVPTVVAALGRTTSEDGPATETFELRRGDGVFSLARAAAYAAESTGSEVSGADTESSDPGRGRWAVLRHRRRRAMPTDGEIAIDLQSGLDSEAHAES